MLFLILFTNLLYSQTGNLAIQWNQEVGCQSYDFDGPKRILLSNIQYSQCINVCEFSSVEYQLIGDTSTVASVNWIIAGGNVETQSVLTNNIDWLGAGFGTIQLNITFTNGTIVTKILCIKKIKLPIAHFNVLGQENETLPIVCKNQDVHFINTSLPNDGEEIVTYLWDFGDGTTSEAENPIHAFSQLGTNTVRLTVTNKCNCSKIFDLAILVKQSGVTIHCASVACENQVSVYSVNVADLQGCTTGVWNQVTGGEILNYSPDNLQIEVLWNNVPANGFGYVYYDNTSCSSSVECAIVNAITIPIIKTTGQIEGNSIVCKDNQSHYKLPQWPTTDFVWSLEDNNGTGSTLILTDQRNEVIISAAGMGNIVLTCNYTNTLLNCGGRAIFEIEVKGQMVISGPSKLCKGSSATYSLIDSGQNSPIIGNWTLSGPEVFDQTGTGTSFTGLFIHAGTYVLNVQNNDYCDASVFTITVNPEPVVPSGITGPILVCPSTPTIYTVQNPQQGFVYSWAVTNGTIIGSTYGESITVRFNNNTVPNPDYTVTVRACNNTVPYCCSNPFTLNANKIVPVFDIVGDTNVCASSSENYSTAYTGAEDYIWEIDPPVAGSITLGNGTNTVSVTWNNYDDDILPPVSLRLRVRKCNEYHTVQEQINIIFSPTITLTTDAPNATVCRGADFTVTVNSSLPITEIDYINWDFGDGNIFTTPFNTLDDLSYTHNYDVISTLNPQYTVTVVVYGANGCVYPTTANIDITVIPTPVATLTPSVTIHACQPTDINISYFVNIQQGFGQTTSIDWFYDDDGDGDFDLIQSVSGTNPITTSYTPTGFGQYYAVVYYVNGCSTETNVNTIHQQCPDTGCNGAPNISPLIVTRSGCNTFTVSTATISPAPYQYLWAGSGGVTINSPIVSGCNLTIDQPGNYYIGYRAGYLLPNQTVCSSSVAENFFVPYMADLRYTTSCNNTNNTYDVTLLNHSVVASGFTIANYQFNINGGLWIDMGTTQNYTIPGGLAPGTYQVGILISTSGYFSCTKTIELILPAFPVATFTPNALTTCPDIQIQFVPTYNVPGSIYFWQFGDGSTNYQQSPIKTYDNHSNNPNLNNVSLTVTNPLGCSATYTYSNTEATIYGANMTGTIKVLPIDGTACQGGDITLNYVPNPTTQTPTSYEWHKEGDANFIDTVSSPFYHPTTSGTYWLVVYNANGCKRIIPVGKIVSFTPVPTPVIKGPTSACLANWFTLDGYVGGAVEYIWSRNNTVIAFTPSITQIETAVGTYFYTLQLKIPKPNPIDGFCYSTLTTHSITILNQPVAPIITIANVDCGKYHITLNAVAAEPGFFSWSNGGSGSTTIVTNGGPVQVRFTNLAGCSSTAQIMIPHAPSYYLWVFPRGCYEFCKKEIEDTVGNIIGPLEPMPEWQWLIDTTIVNANTDTLVPVLPIIDSGTYQLALGTGLCPTVDISPPLTIAVNNACSACPYDVTVVDIVPQHDMYNNLYYEVVIEINNTSGSDSYSSLVNAPGFGGTFIPSGITILDGPNNYNFIFIPPANFTQGMLTFYFNSETPCIGNFKITFPPYVDDKALLISERITRDTAYLYAVPNPSKDNPLLYFNSGIAEDTENYTLVIYDTTGRVLLEKSCSSKGAIPLNFSTFPVGMYSILMKNGATIVNRTKFIKN